MSLVLQICLLASGACYTPREAVVLYPYVGKCSCDTLLWYRTASLVGGKLTLEQDTDVVFRSARGFE